MIDTDFYIALSSAIGALKAYPNIAAKNANAPFVVYQRVSTQRSTTLDGPDGLAVASYRVDIYAKSLLEAQQIAYTACVELVSYKSDSIHYITIINEQDGSDVSGSPDLYRIILDIDASYSWL
ncbi:MULTISPECIES: hypothetical protein [unclassified Sphingobium]|uniref:tail completion protein gp17 n=1 Tax=unclassified Sphingobium TaxID=2611147 RepID=UPI002225A8C1|nr:MULTISPECIES: hypothetical protein [unclassified Sphingobium]MCW2412933.1 hypothetical protein [Sphingobium sp. B8D3D]MCW2414769.1 hypothetical protein [Sphingobium sp. B8D3A]